MARSIELVMSIASGVVGILGWLYALFGPVYASSTGAHASVAQISLNPISVAFFAMMLLAVLGVAVGGYLHHQRGGAWPAVLWTSTLLLVVGTILSGFSVGAFLVPAALLALLAAVIGTSSSARPASS